MLCRRFHEQHQHHIWSRVSSFLLLKAFPSRNAAAHWQTALTLHICKAVIQAVMHKNALLTSPVSCCCHNVGFLSLVHLSLKLSYKLLHAVRLRVLCYSMTTVSELVDKGDIPEERKEHVKSFLQDLGYAAGRAVGKAFLKITEKHMTDAGMSIADANAILAEVDSMQGSLLLLKHW